MSHDIPPYCQRCGIPIYDGTNHSTMIGCFHALKAFVKVCQDQIEEDRMSAMSHSDMVNVDMIRELGWSVGVHNDYYVNEQFNTFWLFTHPDGRYVKAEGPSDGYALSLIHGTIVGNGSTGANTDDSIGRARHQDYDESVSPAQERASWAAFDSNQGVIRDLLPSDVSHESEGVVSDKEEAGGSAYYSSRKPTQAESVRPPIPPTEGLSSQG